MVHIQIFFEMEKQQKMIITLLHSSAQSRKYWVGKVRNQECWNQLKNTFEFYIIVCVLLRVPYNK